MVARRHVEGKICLHERVSVHMRGVAGLRVALVVIAFLPWFLGASQLSGPSACGSSIGEPPHERWFDCMLNIARVRYGQNVALLYILNEVQEEYLRSAETGNAKDMRELERSIKALLSY